MAHIQTKSASLHYASFLTLTEVKYFRYSADAIYRADCKREKSSIRTFYFLHFLFSSVPPAFLVVPSPPHRSTFSVFPSFLIHFLCITPLLSTPIYSALPPPILHKHTLYFSLPFLQTLCWPPLLPHSPPLHYDTFLFSFSIPLSLSFSAHHAACLCHCWYPPFNCGAPCNLATILPIVSFTRQLYSKCQQT